MISQMLFANVGYPDQLNENFLNISITGLSSDSRFAKEGDLFFARKGLHGHGLDYYEVLVEKGIALILYEDDEKIHLPDIIPAIKINDIQLWIPKFAEIFYKEQLHKLSLIAVTGTEGKTSVTQFIAKIYTELSRKCGLVGTNGIGFLDDLKENTHTTPDLLALYESLSEIEKQFDSDFKPVALEVTSHALEQKRVAGLSFAVTVLTNLTRDHLDYHGTIDAYKRAKSRLFLEYSSKISILNIEDTLGKELFETLCLKSDRELYAYGESDFASSNYFRITKLELVHDGLRFNLHFGEKSYPISSTLYGRFNAYNLTAAMASMVALGIPIEQITAVIPLITNVKGRMEMVALDKGVVGIVDYAHKPNALLQALLSLKEHLHNGRLICVFGCGGDRDKGKRPLMAEIAEQHADIVVVTSDNPRHESPSMIIEEIIAGFKNPQSEKIITIESRHEAIHHALSIARKGDIVLIAGKGHEDYQVLGDTVIHFSDIEEINRFNKVE